MRNISAWAIRNPVIPLVLFAGLLAMGLLAFMRMDVNLNPDISAPAATVTISQPGAAPPELEIQITPLIIKHDRCRVPQLSRLLESEKEPVRV